MTGTAQDLILEERVSAVFDGIALDIIARQLTPAQWALNIRNCYGVMTTWTATFATAEAALAAGLRAIEDEGATTFMDMEGFEYLLE